MSENALPARPTGPGVTVDVDEVRSVVGFYRSASVVVGDAAARIGADELGEWAGADYAEMGRRYRDMGRVIAERLTEQSRAARRLADALDRGITTLVDTDAEIGDHLREARPCADESGAR
ncbi:hypothetical protein [Gordonia sp. OPL2]|uniref:hypothetical protein n=1 Tax=Gordonia sp. OPL2 TaxID=2486274 RepID=UPI0016556563|nr:hypothetical protein [Gordonia sp. OPL2]RPA12158.1 hypothetical protein EEB19_07500 [Gordonia sp. OPL2]